MNQNTQGRFEALVKYFPSGVAAGERLILERVFVKDDDFSEIMTPSPGNPRLLVGKKGAGKSAFLEIAATLLASANVPVVMLVPSDLDIENVADSSIAATSRAFLISLVQAISIAAASRLGKFVTSGELPLHAAALQSGDKSLDVVERLSRLVSEIDFEGVKFNPQALLGGQGFSLRVQVDAIKENIERTGGAFYLLLDDLDQVSSLSGALDVERIYASLVAVKKLAADIPKLRVIVTLRDEVWRALGRARSEKIDQMDHFQLGVRFMSPSKDQIKIIIRKRLEAAADEFGERGTFNEYEPFFKGTVARMPSSEQLSSWDDLIVSRCRERPRDAVQLINVLGSRRIGTDELIDDDVLASVMPGYSQQRVDLLQQEYSSVCPQITNIVENLRFLPFNAGAFTSLTADVKAFLEKTILGKFGVSVDGRRLSRTSIDDVFEIWRLLFDVSVLNARISDTRESDGYRHVSPRDEPGFVSLARWNEMQAVTWEVHPAYRDRLMFLQREDAARHGLAIKPRKARRNRN